MYIFACMKSIRRETLFGIWALASTANKFKESDCLEQTIDTSRELYLALCTINKKVVKIKNGDYNDLCVGCKQIFKTFGRRYDDIFNHLSVKEPTMEKSYVPIKKMVKNLEF